MSNNLIILLLFWETDYSTMNINSLQKYVLMIKVLSALISYFNPLGKEIPVGGFKHMVT